MIFTFASCPLPTLSRSPKQKASRDVPKAPRDAPQGVSGAPKSLSEMLWKHPRASLRRPEAPRGVPRGSRSSQKPPKTPPKLPKASLRRPRSTPRHSRGSPEVPKSFPVTSRKPLRGSSRGKCAPTRRRNNKRHLLRSHWGTRPQRNSRPLADKITNEACFKATGERSHTAHVLVATEQELNR